MAKPQNPEPTNGTLTYGQLYDRLNSLGYHSRTVSVDVGPARIFEHDTIPNSMIALPDRAPGDEVEKLYMHSVLVNLRSHGTLPESPNPLLSGS